MSTVWKRTSLLLMAVTMTVSLFGCSSGGSNEPKATNDTGQNNEHQQGTEEENEPITLKVFHGNQIVLPNAILDNPVMQELEKRTGIKIDWSPYMGGADAKQTLSALIASNDLPDLIINADPATNKMLIQNDLIMPLGELVQQHGPELNKNLSDALSMSKLLMSEGKDDLYFIPGNVNYVSFWPMGYDTVFQYRYDLYKKMGKPKLESLDDLLNFGIEARKIEPMTVDGQKTYTFGIPFADAGGWTYVDWDKSHYDGYWGSNNFIYLDIENDKVAPRLNDPDNSFWTSAEFYNKAYREGLLDPESATMKFQQVQDKGKALRYHVGLASWQIGWPNGVILGNKDKEKGFVPTLLDSKPNNTFYEFSFPVGNGMWWSIPKSSKNAERVMQLMNFVASYEGAELFYNGPEGLNWDMKDGIPMPHERDPNAPADPDAAKKLGSGYVAPNFILNGSLENPKGWKVRYGDNNPSDYVKDMTEMEKEFIKEHDLDYPTQIFNTRPNHTANTALIDSIKSDPNSDIAVLEQKINNYLDTNVAKIVYSKTEEDFMKAKEKFLSDLKEMGIEQVVGFYDKEYEEMKQSLVSLQ